MPEATRRKIATSTTAFGLVSTTFTTGPARLHNLMISSPFGELATNSPIRTATVETILNLLNAAIADLHEDHFRLRSDRPSGSGAL